MKKKILSIMIFTYVLAVCMIFTCVPVTVYAADEPGDVYDLLDEVLKKGGTQKLERDYIVTRFVAPLTKSVTIDLNGHVILFKGGQFVFDKKKITLTIKDSLAESGTKPVHTGEFKYLPFGGVVASTHGGTSGGIVNVADTCTFNLDKGGILYGGYAASEPPGSSDPGKGYGGGVYINSDGTFNMKGGIIHGCTASTHGGAVYVESNGKFNMSGGTIENCKAQGELDEEKGGAVYIEENGIFDMTDGKIYGCSAYYGSGAVFAKGTFTMSNGTIDNCVAYGGGGITIVGKGTFTMSGGTIKNCKANYCGGAVVAGNIFTMSGGVIENCESEDFGGAVSIMSASNGAATFNLNGGTIKNCKAKHGGAVANGNGSKYISHFNMTSGTIDNCEAELSGGGVNNEIRGISTMDGGTIKNCKAYCGGGVYVVCEGKYDKSAHQFIPTNGTDNELSKFNMNGGTIENCKSVETIYGKDNQLLLGRGGGICVLYGTFTMTDGTIKNCSSIDGKGDAVWLYANADMIADGGSVYGECLVEGQLDDTVCEITNTSSSKYTKFYDKIENQGTISGGVFYGGIKNTKNKNGVYGNVTSPYKIVLFDLNGASGSIPNQWLVNATGATAHRPTAPTRENYKFMGWYKGDNLYDFSTAVPENTIGLYTLKAKWVWSHVSTESGLYEAINAGITSIKLIGDIELSKTLTLTNKDITLDLNGHTLTGNIKLSSQNLLVKTSLTLTDSNPTATHTDKTLPLGGVLDGSITLTKTSIGYSSSLYANGGTVTGQVSLSNNFAIIHCTSSTPTAFRGSVDGTGEIHGGMFYDYINPGCIEEATMVFINDGKRYALEVVEYGSKAVAPVIPEKDGYAFAGWYNGSTKYDFTQTVTSNITLTAKWVNEVNTEATLREAINAGVNPIKLMADIKLSSALDLSLKNVTIDLNGYVISGSDISINTGSGKATLTLKDSRPTATHTDSTLPSGGVVTSKISMEQSGGRYNDCVLYANGGTVTSEFNTNTNAVAIKSTSDTPTVFTGKISGYTHLYDGIYYGTVNSSVTFEENKITFKNGNDIYAYEVLSSDKKSFEPAPPAIKAGYQGFDGWYNGNTKYTFGSALSEDITLTAKFSNPQTYNITYDLDGGTASNPATYTVESNDIQLNNPTKSGYTFTGWSGTGLNGSNNMAVTIPKGSTGHRTYTAHFKDVTLPTGEISIGTNKWDSLNNEIAFELFFKDTLTVKITASDNSGKAVKIEYLLSDRALDETALATAAFTEYTREFRINTDNQYVIYARLTDVDQNVTYLSSNGMVLDTTAPVITGIENGKTYCEEQTVTIDETYIDSVTVNGTKVTLDEHNQFTLRPSEGTQTIVVTDKANNTSAEMVVTVNNAHTAGKDDGDCSTPVTCIYHPDTVVVQAKSHDFSGTCNKDDDGHWHTCQNDGCTVTDSKTPHSGKDDGDCTTAVLCECGYTITEANAEHSYGEWKSNGNDTHTRYCTVDGCSGNQTGNCTGGEATHTTKAICEICKEEYGELLTDATAPTGEISIDANKWNNFYHTITFELFFKDTQTVQITASDNSGEAVKIEYLLSDRALDKTELATAIFTEYTGSFSIAPDHEYVIYARLTDTSENVTYLSSNGMILDSTAPVITGIENGATYCEEQTVTIDETYIDSVTVNGTKVPLDENNQFTLHPSEGTQTIVVTDKANNTSAEMIVTVHGAHTAGKDDGDCSTPVTCIYHPDTVVVEAKSHDFSGNWNKDDDGHWHTCQNDGCTVADSKAPHSAKDNGDCTTGIICECGYTITEATNEHSYGEWKSNGDGTHTRYCTVDGCSGKETGNCTGGEATCIAKAICEICKEEYGEIDSNNHTLKLIPAKKATVTTTGNKKYWHCQACDRYFSDQDGKNSIEQKDTIIAKLPPKIIEGMGQSIREGEKKELTFRSNAGFSDFIRVELDGKTLDEKNYTVKEGSTVVTLKADYVATLSVGQHTIGIVSESGTASTTFIVNKKVLYNNEKTVASSWKTLKNNGTTTVHNGATTVNNENGAGNNRKSPQTGDNSHTALWIVLFFISGGLLIVTGVYRKKKSLL